ncbi:MAG: baseplate J/gp47 family protein, partial [Candidatus Cloacimonetes bacterium]|nr:baseplate J/gp47 family protein [Candidatus Cloacimonadota bacterium]
MNDDKELLILNMLKEAYPDLDSGIGTPFYELVVRPMVFLWTRHAEGSAELKDANVLENYNTMNPADLDRLMTRFFETRKQGNLVYATVRIVFKTLRDYYIPQGMVFLTDDNRQYTTIVDAYYSQMELPGTPALGYTVDVSVVSEAVGNKYNLSMNDAMT